MYEKKLPFDIFYPLIGQYCSKQEYKIKINRNAIAREEFYKKKKS